MPLSNFGSILNFAESIEISDQKAYKALAQNPACASYQEVFNTLFNDARKSAQIVQRTRRENVTEMILEPIKGFFREPFIAPPANFAEMNLPEALNAVRLLEQRARCFYLQASEKIKALPEVSRTLKQLARKRQKRLAACAV